ncbi:hypothetical protein PR202_ga17179 [Eleusine coracana subsp. coracana]|uniref:Protein FAR1-RELATED SEQUENCE n=1 Tax=Eleusine coracana subsp. coracana TaxID=191504 RepID=A0AAV5CPW0_ELECO|nr:hypothetical protein PR202_ga17179 [Eleusine coracana subsp. coracana]
MGRNVVGIPGLATSMEMPKSRDNSGGGIGEESAAASFWANLLPPPSQPHTPSTHPSPVLPSSAASYTGSTGVCPAPKVPATPSQRIVLPAPSISDAATGGAECSHGRNTMTPPEGISPSAMMTPDAEKTYCHDPLMPTDLVPKEELQFESRDEAYQFYLFYARIAGLNVRITKTHPNVDQDSSMAAAIKRVFMKTIHPLCRWHMLKKYMLKLKQLYDAHESKVIGATLHPFDSHLSRVYTRAVYKKYKETYMNSTAFHIDVDKERENGYLVTHTNESRKYAWYQHPFKVFANVEAGVFESVEARGRGGSSGRRGTMGTKRGRPPFNRQLEQDFLEVADEEDTDEELDTLGDD